MLYTGEAWQEGASHATWVDIGAYEVYMQAFIEF